MSSTNQTISDLAFQLWHVRGCPVGSPDIDWLEAERQVTGNASKESSEVALHVYPSTTEGRQPPALTAGKGSQNPARPPLDSGAESAGSKYREL